MHALTPVVDPLPGGRQIRNCLRVCFVQRGSGWCPANQSCGSRSLILMPVRADVIAAAPYPESLQPRGIAAGTSPLENLDRTGGEV